MPAAIEAEVVCTHVLKSGSMFGERTDNGEMVFIPPSVTKATSISLGHPVRATIIPNKHDRDRTPWFAVRVEVTNAKKTPDDFGCSVEDYIHSVDYTTTKEVAEEFGASSRSTAGALDALFNQGRLSKANVYRVDPETGTSARELTLWATETERFLGDFT